MEPIIDLIEAYLKYCKFEKKLNEKSLKAYQIDLKQFRLYLKKRGILSINAVSKRDIKDYLQSIGDTYKISTIKRKVASIKALFNHLEFEELLLEKNPFRLIRLKLKPPRVLPRTIAVKEVEKILKYIYRQKKEIKDRKSYSYKTTIRDIAIIELLFATGIRVSELCNLRSKDIELELAYIKVYGKGNKERVINICDQNIIRILKEYKKLFLGQSHRDHPFFINRLGKRYSEQSARFLIVRYANLAGIKKRVTPHVIRHTFATALLDEGVDIRYIQSFLGHSSILTTQIYTHVSQKQQQLILQRNHPRRRFNSF